MSSKAVTIIDISNPMEELPQLTLKRKASNNTRFKDYRILASNTEVYLKFEGLRVANGEFNVDDEIKLRVPKQQQEVLDRLLTSIRNSLAVEGVNKEIVCLFPHVKFLPFMCVKLPCFQGEY